MRIERVGENKIRIFVSYDDLEERDIDLDALNYNTPETQDLFWDLMEQAEIELGFDEHESQLCIETVSDIEHGFVITITRVDAENEFESIQKFIKNRYRRKDLEKSTTSSAGSKILIYAVDSFDNLCMLSAAICPLYSGRSMVYRLKNTWYLVLKSIENNISNISKFESILSEYADKMPGTEFFEGYLNEYGKSIMKNNAIPYFAKLIK
jgi:adapter protein MecA 1/2